METLLPTTKHRRGRRTARQERALAAPGGALVALVDLSTDDGLAGTDPIVLDIGFGSGEAVVALAEAEPSVTILAVDMHTPGIGDLLASISEKGLANVRVVEADVRHVLEAIPVGRLAGVRTFFPDPWPKKRHHRRRLVTPSFAEALAPRVGLGGFWHLATDWPEYAEAIEGAVAQCTSWRGGVIARPDSRPQTRYERRGLAAGRAPIDLWFERVGQ
jgi:tRNA (guanine-N7-)-methyltransferase